MKRKDNEMENYHRWFTAMDRQSVEYNHDVNFDLQTMNSKDQAKQINYIVDNSIKQLIDVFTIEPLDMKKIQEIVDNISLLEDIKIWITDKMLKVSLSDRTLLVNKLTSIFPELKDFAPELSTDGRHHLCHDGSLKLANVFRNFSPVIVTGFIGSLSIKSQILHSWIEITGKDSTYVMDYTLNAIMSKDDYYALRHAKPESFVTYQQIKEDENIINQVYQQTIRPNQQGEYETPLNAKTYLYFRDEIMRDLNKNSHLFK